MASHYLVNLISKEDYDIADEDLKDYISKDFLDDNLHEDDSEFEDYLSAEEAYYLDGNESVFYMCLEEDLAIDNEDRYAKMSVRNLMRKFRQIEKLTKKGKLREAKALANEMNMESNNVKKALRKFRNKKIAKKVLKVIAILSPVIGTIAGIATVAKSFSDEGMQNIGNDFKEAFSKLGSSASTNTFTLDDFEAL